MYVSPQRRTIFRHLNLQKCSEHVMFCTLSLQNVLFTTAACNFWCLLSAPTSAPAALTGLLFDWPDTRIIEKTQHFATSLTFRADVYLLSSDFRASASSSFRLDYSTLLFNCPYCRKFLFKLPSINIIMTIGFIFCFSLSSLINPTIQYSHFNLPTSLSFSGLRTETMTRWIGEIVHLRMLAIRGLTFPSSLNPALNGKSCNNIKKQSINSISALRNAYKMHINCKSQLGEWFGPRFVQGTIRSVKSSAGCTTRALSTEQLHKGLGPAFFPRETIKIMFQTYPTISC